MTTRGQPNRSSQGGYAICERARLQPCSEGRDRKPALGWWVSLWLPGLENYFRIACASSTATGLSLADQETDVLSSPHIFATHGISKKKPCRGCV
jgi:hypothetical protein